jgi:hypothetical protein
MPLPVSYYLFSLYPALCCLLRPLPSTFCFLIPPSLALPPLACFYHLLLPPASS